MIDACKAAGVEHVVFCSLIDSDPGHKSEKFNLHHFHSKRDLELYLKVGASHTLTRPLLHLPLPIPIRTIPPLTRQHPAS